MHPDTFWRDALTPSLVFPHHYFCEWEVLPSAILGSSGDAVDTGVAPFPPYMPSFLSRIELIQLPRRFSTIIIECCCLTLSPSPPTFFFLCKKKPRSSMHSVKLEPPRWSYHYENNTIPGSKHADHGSYRRYLKWYTWYGTTSYYTSTLDIMVGWHEHFASMAAGSPIAELYCRSDWRKLHRYVQLKNLKLSLAWESLRYDVAYGLVPGFRLSTIISTHIIVCLLFVLTSIHREFIPGTKSGHGLWEREEKKNTTTGTRIKLL